MVAIKVYQQQQQPKEKEVEEEGGGGEEILCEFSCIFIIFIFSAKINSVRQNDLHWRLYK